VFFPLINITQRNNYHHSFLHLRTRCRSATHTIIPVLITGIQQRIEWQSLSAELLIVIVQSETLKTQPNHSHVRRYKIKSEVGPSRVIDYDNLPRDTGVKVTLVARSLLTPAAQKLCRCKVFSRRVLILKHYFASKSFAAVREAFSKAYPDKEVAYWVKQQCIDW
jgi:hypothetical protein